MIEDLSDILFFAEDLADLSRSVIEAELARGYGVAIKGDGSPVTDVDRAVEAALRARIADRFPNHGIIGEEFENDAEEAEDLWVLDPIDGTKQFACGLPLYGTLIAFVRAGRPLVGVMDFPATRERWCGAAGRPATRNSRAVKVRDCAELSTAWVACGSPTRGSAAEIAAGLRLAKSGGQNVWGGGSYAFAQVASGRIDLAPDCGLDVHDYAAVVPILEGAGGLAVTWRGAPLTLTAGSQVLFLGDPRLKEAALSILEEAALPNEERREKPKKALG
jgi:histidinol phosphatase-like enzyme (inositol monophosphatase family)